MAGNCVGRCTSRAAVPGTRRRGEGTAGAEFRGNNARGSREGPLKAHGPPPRDPEPPTGPPDPEPAASDSQRRGESAKGPRLAAGGRGPTPGPRSRRRPRAGGGPLSPSLNQSVVAEEQCRWVDLRLRPPRRLAPPRPRAGGARCHPSPAPPGTARGPSRRRE